MRESWQALSLLTKLFPEEALNRYFSGDSSTLSITEDNMVGGVHINTINNTMILKDDARAKNHGTIT